MDQAVEQPSLAVPQPPSVQEAWEMVTGQLRAEVRRGDYDSFVAAMQPLSFKEGVFRVGAINAYARDWVESRLINRITKLLTITYGQAVTLHFTLINGAERLAEAAQPEKSRAGGLNGAVESSIPAARNGSAGAVNGSGASKTSGGIINNGVANNGVVNNGVVNNGVETGDASNNRGAAVNGAARTGATEVERSPLNGRKKKSALEADLEPVEEGGSRKVQLQRAYGTERASVVQPERSLFITLYLFSHWLPLIGHSAFTVILAARSLCYWNVRTGELRNTIETDMSELARRASVSVRTVKDVLNQDLVKQYFMRYKVRRVMTSNGVRTAGIVLQVRMDDPLTPEDQAEHNLPEEDRWYTADFEEEEED